MKKISPLAQNILAENLLNIGAVHFIEDKPLRLRSGLVTPIYVDNRRITTHPEDWRDIIETMASVISEEGIECDIVAGVEGAGVSHAAALAYRMGKPNVFVRQTVKTFDNNSRIEGGSVAGRKVLMIEDHISTGLSCLDAIRYLRDNGATVTDCLSITDFGIAETRNLFAQAGVATHDMISFGLVVDMAVSLGKIDMSQKALIDDWLENPWTWALRHGVTPVGAEN